MNNRLLWVTFIIIIGIGCSILYYTSDEDIRASIIFFGSLILVCLVAGILIASCIKYFISHR